MVYSKVDVQIIKLAVSNIESQGLSSKQVLIDSIRWLTQKYLDTLEEAYLNKAVLHIYCYLELGYPYELGRKEFDIILSYLGKEEEELFPKRKYKYKKIVLSRANIKKILGRWNPKLHCMKIDEVVEDIIQKIQNKDYGEYCYHSGKLLLENDEKCLWEQTYKLYVDVEETIFHHINENKYYVFTKEKSNDKSSIAR